MTQRNKNILLVIGFIAMLFIAYRYSFSETFRLKKQISDLKSQNINAENLARLSANLQQREQFADSILKSNNFKNISVQNNLLEFLNKEAAATQFSISQFLEPHTTTKDGVTVTSYQFTLKGSYSNIEQVLYQLEQDYNFGKIAHVQFEKKRDYRRGKNYLECFVVVEGFVSN